MLGPYGEIALRKIKSKESIKKVIQIISLAFSLVCREQHRMTVKKERDQLVRGEVGPHPDSISAIFH